MIRLIIAGSRSFNDYQFLVSEVDKFIKENSDGLENSEVIIVSGMAKGADMLGVKYAADKGYQVEAFPADWSLGRSAGPQRNLKMAKYANSCIAFWDGNSRGTASMIALAKKHNLKLKVVEYK